MVRIPKLDHFQNRKIMPVLLGWFWSGSEVRLGSADGAVTGAWSPTGGAKEPQPDNREWKVEGKHDEACIAVLNNFYADGVVRLYRCSLDILSWIHLAGLA